MWCLSISGQGPAYSAVSSSACTERVAGTLEPITATLSVRETWGLVYTVPRDWRRVLLPDGVHSGQAPSIVYEAPLTRSDDRFRDYLMLELSTGKASGDFVADGSMPTRRDVIDGHPARIDRIVLSDYPSIESGSAGEPLTLVSWQAVLRGPGYRLSFVAVGECAEEPVLLEVFDLLRGSVQLRGRPFPSY